MKVNMDREGLPYNAERNMSYNSRLAQELSKWAEGSAHNPVVFAAVTLLLVVTSALAALIPARRASSVDPMEALRYE